MDMQKIRISETAPNAREWADAVGRFFLNFGLIELVTTEFIKRMASEFKYKSMKKKFLSQKLTWIIDGLSDSSNADRQTRLDTVEALEAIRELSIFRNVLAHAALGVDVSDQAGGADCKLTGALNFKPDDEDEESELISLEEIRERMIETESLAKRLLDLLNGMELKQAAE